MAAAKQLLRVSEVGYAAEIAAAAQVAAAELAAAAKVPTPPFNVYTYQNPRFAPDAGSKLCHYIERSRWQSLWRLVLRKRRS